LVILNPGGDTMSRLKKDPSSAGVSAASVKGNAGPTQEVHNHGKKTSQNQQYGKQNMQDN
jgi:YuzL-like protein